MSWSHDPGCRVACRDPQGTRIGKTQFGPNPSLPFLAVDLSSYSLQPTSPSEVDKENIIATISPFGEEHAAVEARCHGDNRPDTLGNDACQAEEEVAHEVVMTMANATEGRGAKDDAAGGMGEGDGNCDGQEDLSTLNFGHFSRLLGGKVRA